MISSSSSWKTVSLGDICTFNYGKALPESARTGGKIPVFGSNGIIGYHNTALTTGRAIVIGRKGSFGEVNYSYNSCWPIDTAYFVDENGTQENIRWLSYRLAALGLKQLNKAAAVPGLNREDAYRKQLLLPPLHEQRRIAAILDQADALRAKRREALAQLDALKQSIFIEMFGDMAKNPMAWQWQPLGSIAEKFSDGPFGSNLKSEHYVESGIRVVRLQNIGVGKFINDNKAFVSQHHYETIKKHECKPGDVLVGTMGDPNLRACILPNSIPLAINKADCVQIRVNTSRANSVFICALLNHPSTELLAQDLKHGQTRVRISMGSLRGLNVPIPPLSIQKDFSLRICELDLLRSAHIEAMRENNRLFESLQHRAFRGEL